MSDPNLAREERTEVPALAMDRIEAALSSHRPSTIPRAVAPRRSAVAAVLRFERDMPDVLLMKRIERDSDRWSGHVSFPGGMANAEDADLLATAVRETREEVGLDLPSSARLVGQLDDQVAMARGRILPMAITPFVFVQTHPAPLTLGDEAESALWLPLDAAATGALDSKLDYRLGPVPMQLPCWRYDGYVVWGLTYQMLSKLLVVVGAGR